MLQHAPFRRTPPEACCRFLGAPSQAFYALQALAFAKEAVEGFEESTGSSREAALDATRQAADFAQLAHKLMRAVYKGK